jgi:Ser/Thr protein kinase RdoA (MazF antagonist)
MSRIPEVVLASFAFDGKVRSVAPLGGGRIHDTFDVHTEAADGRYVLQRINCAVFHDPAGLMRNVVRVLEHLGASGRSPVAELVPTRCGSAWCTDGAADVWRAFRFVRGAEACGTRPSPAAAAEVGRAFGDFARRLATLPLDALAVLLPGFHDTPSRLDELRRAAATDRLARARGARREIGFLLDRAAVADEIVAWQRSGRLPVRYVHNDTKTDNVLLDRSTGRAVCVLDLDTVMPGLLAYDVGDCVRSALTGWVDAGEMGPERVAATYEAVVAGFVKGGAGSITAEEVSSFLLGLEAIAVELASRFLTDHLCGDVYFRTTEPGENLSRCRAQIAVLCAIERARPGLREITAKQAQAVGAASGDAWSARRDGGRA